MKNIQTKKTENEKNCVGVMGCAVCRGRGNCQEYALWNQNKGYSSTEDWQKPLNWAVENAKLTYNKEQKKFVKTYN